MSIYAKTPNPVGYGTRALFILEEPTVLTLGADIIYRGTPCRIIEFEWHKKTKLSDSFIAMPLYSNKKIPKYSRFTKIKLIKQWKKNLNTSLSPITVG